MTSVAVTPGEVAERWLADAYELLAAGWCRGAAAVDEAGAPIEPESSSARRFSAPGALVRIWKRSDLEAELGVRALQLANLALTAAVNDIPTSWNDAPGRRHDEVLEAVLAAVSLVRDPTLVRMGGVGTTTAADAFDTGVAPSFAAGGPQPA